MADDAAEKAAARVGLKRALQALCAHQVKYPDTAGMLDTELPAPASNAATDAATDAFASVPDSGISFLALVLPP